MRKQINNQPLTPKEKSLRRQAVMDEIAAKVTKDPMMTWRRLETRIKKAHEAGREIITIK